MDICTEESVSYELEAVVSFGFHKSWLYISSYGGQRIRVHIEGTVFFVVNTLFFIYDIFVETNGCFACIGSFYPVDRSFDFTSVRSVAALGSRIVSTVYNTHSTVIICFISCTGDEVSVHKTNFSTYKKSLVFTWRLDHEVLTLNIKLLTKWKLTCSESFVFHVVRSFQVFNLTFRIVIDHEFDRIKDCHHTRTFELEILTDTVFKHSVVNGTVGLGYTAEVNEHLDGFRSETSSAESGDGNETRIIPSVYDAVLNKFLDVTLAGNNVCQV